MSVPAESTEPVVDGDAPVALVTGASRGIGSYLAQGFCAAGYDVAVTSTSGAGFDELIAQAESSGRRVLPLSVDVRDAQATQTAVETVVAQLGRLDVLVNNAGVIETEHVIWESDLQQWWDVLEVNVRGVLHMSQAAARYFVSHDGGRIINLNSGSGGSDSADLSAYHASKSALARITTGLALSGEQHGLYAFDMAPGVVRTDMTSAMKLHEGRSEWTEPAQVVELALALASGALDAYSGRMVRAGSDTPASLQERAASGLGEHDRRLRWHSYGPSDPVVQSE